MSERRPMRLLFVVHGLPRVGVSGGVEIFTFSLAGHLSRRGHSILFFCPNPGGAHPPLPRGTAVCFAPPRSGDSPEADLADPRIEREFAQAVKRFKPDLVHIHHLRGLSAGIMPACRRLGVPYVVTLQDFWMFCDHVHLYPGAGIRSCADSDHGKKCATCFLHVHYRGLTSGRTELTTAERFVRLRRAAIARDLRAAECLIAPSEFVRKRFCVEWNDFRSRIVLVRDGIDPVSPRARPPHRRPVFGFFGGVAEVKGLYVLLNALERLARPPELRIYSADRTRIRRWLDAAEYGPDLRRVIRVRGGFRRPELGRILAGLDAVVIPSFVETFSLVAAESLSAGKPVIASRAGAIGELVADGVNGFLFEPGDSTRLAELIRRCADNPRILRRLNVTGAVRTIEAAASEMIPIYENILSRAGRGSDRSQRNGTWALSKKLRTLRKGYDLIRRAVAMKSAGRPDRAAAIYRKILRGDPDHIVARYQLANCFRETGDVQSAETAYRRVLASIGRLPVRISTEAYEATSAFYLAEILWSRRAGRESARMLKRCLKIIPYHPKARRLGKTVSVARTRSSAGSANFSGTPAKRGGRSRF